MRQRKAFTFRLAADPEGAWLRRISVFNEHAFGPKDCAYPTDMLVDRKGKVIWLHAVDDLRVRLTSDEIIENVDRALADASAPH